MARLFVTETGNLAVWGFTFDDQIPPETWSLIATYDEYEHPVLHQKLSDNVKNAAWNPVTRQLVINGEVVLNATWITAAENAVNAAIQNRATDNSERAVLLQQAEAALTQIATDRAAIASGKTALATATTLAQVKQIVNGMLDIDDNMLQQQARIIRVLRALVRSGLGSG